MVYVLGSEKCPGRKLTIGVTHRSPSHTGFLLLSLFSQAYLLKALSVEPITFFPSLSSLLHILF